MVEILRPLKPGDWIIQARSTKVAKKWDELCNSNPSRCQKIYDQLTSNPTYDDGHRQGKMRGKLSKVVFEERVYERWQIDINSSGRIWYFLQPYTQVKTKIVLYGHCE